MIESTYILAGLLLLGIITFAYFADKIVGVLMLMTGKTLGVDLLQEKTQ